MKIKLVSLVMCLVVLLVCGCSKDIISMDDMSEDGDFVQESTNYLQSESNLETTEVNEYQEYLNSISPKYVLLDTTTPGFVGRWFEKKVRGINHMVTLNDGSALYFMTDGAKSFNVEFTLITEQVPYFAYSVDGSEPVRQLITSPVVELPDDGKHIVRIFADGLYAYEGKWNYERGFAFKTVSVDMGDLFGIMPQSKVIAYYGDSITEGIAALGSGNSSTTNSGTSAYPYFCSEVLGAVTYNAGYSASGVCKEGSFKPFIEAIDNISRLTKVDATFAPDVIVVNHGTNDSSYGSQEFITELKKALDRLIEKYPDTPIFYMIPFGQYKASDIRSTIALYAGKADITIVETQSWSIQFTDGVHPTAKGAKEAGEKLASAIKAKLGKEFFAVG